MNSSINWQLKIRDKTHKTLSRFPKKDQERLTVAIEGLPTNPFIRDIEKMRGEENIWRRRIGAYRIFYEINLQEKVIYVFRIERRTSKTY
jgi:mRNA interferase RelE/StbE